MRSHSILNRLFGTAEEINGGNRCATYLYRWVIGSFRDAKAYLHHFVGDDWTRDLHDHPKRFISIGLWGSYVEHSEGRDGRTQIRAYVAPWIRSFPAEHRHRLIKAAGCWTLVIVLNAEREWGFWHDGKMIPWRDYVKGSSSHVADQMKDC